MFDYSSGLPLPTHQGKFLNGVNNINQVFVSAFTSQVKLANTHTNFLLVLQIKIGRKNDI